MASSSGSSPAFLQPRRNRIRFWCCLLAGGLATLSAVAALPGYLRSALDSFQPGLPPGWACTLATTRNRDTLVERFDPAQSPGKQWTLLQCHDRPPTDEEKEKYQQSRPPGSTVGQQAVFQKADIEPGSLVLEHEDAERAVYKGAFRAESTGADKMLGHLVLHLTANKIRPHIEKYTLSLETPYSPVLGVKMNELQVEAEFLPPGPDRPSLPAKQTSRFTGRILLISTEEALQVIFSDFTKTP